jgi:hypothetical protein
MGLHWSLRIALPLAPALFLCGCPNPNLYTTPRTLNKGDLQWQAAADGFGASFNTTVPNANGMGTHTETASLVTPTLPSVGIRYGIADGFELGARASNLTSAAIDGKIRLLKGTVDLAVDPGLQFYYLSFSSGNSSASAAVFYFHVPLLVGINLSQAISLVVTPGFVYGLATATVNSTNNTQNAAGSTGVMARAGIGMDFRVTKKLALHPEVTFMKGFQDQEALLYIFGLGFNIGAQPDFSDIGSEAPAPAPNAPAPQKE